MIQAPSVYQDNRASSRCNRSRGKPAPQGNVKPYTSSSPIPIPHCKHCSNLGLENHQHWLRDRNNNITCPLLASTECRFCGEKGHTRSHCPAYNGCDIDRAMSVMSSGAYMNGLFTPRATPMKAKKPAKKVSFFLPNSFSHLSYASDEEEGQVVEVVNKVEIEESLKMRKTINLPIAQFRMEPIKLDPTRRSWADDDSDDDDDDDNISDLSEF